MNGFVRPLGGYFNATVIKVFYRAEKPLLIGDNLENMSKNPILFLLFLCIVMILVAGCASQTAATSSSSGSLKSATSMKVTESEGNVIVEIHNGGASIVEYRTQTGFKTPQGVRVVTTDYPAAAPFTSVSATIPVPPDSTERIGPNLQVKYEGGWVALRYEPL